MWLFRGNRSKRHRRHLWLCVLPQRCDSLNEIYLSGRRKNRGVRSECHAIRLAQVLRHPIEYCVRHVSSVPFQAVEGSLIRLDAPGECFGREERCSERGKESHVRAKPSSREKGQEDRRPPKVSLPAHHLRSSTRHHTQQDAQAETLFARPRKGYPAAHGE